MSETTNEKIERQKREMDPNDPLPEGSFFERQVNFRGKRNSSLF